MRKFVTKWKIFTSLIRDKCKLTNRNLRIACIPRLLIIYLSLSLSFGDICSTDKFRYRDISLLSRCGMNFRSAMLMAVEHTSIPFIGACFSCRHPLIFLPSDVCSLLLSLRLFFPENSTPSSDVTGAVLTADSATKILWSETIFTGWICEKKHAIKKNEN